MNVRFFQILHVSCEGTFKLNAFSKRTSLTIYRVEVHLCLRSDYKNVDVTDLK